MQEMSQTCLKKGVCVWDSWASWRSHIVRARYGDPGKKGRPRRVQAAAILDTTRRRETGRKEFNTSTNFNLGRT
jgi:hypothetical protein